MVVRGMGVGVGVEVEGVRGGGLWVARRGWVMGEGRWKIRKAKQRGIRNRGMG